MIRDILTFLALIALSAVLAAVIAGYIPE